LREYSTEFNVQIHAYVLMTNHVHLLATPKTYSGLSKMMQALGRYYVQYFNYQYQRKGTLWDNGIHLTKGPIHLVKYNHFKKIVN